MALKPVRDVKAQALNVLDTVGNFVAKSGERAGKALGSAGRALAQTASGLPASTLRQSSQVAARALTSVGGAVSSTFAKPPVSPQASTNFQAGTASGFDAVFLLVSAIPGVHWAGAGATATYGAMRCAPGLLAQWRGREDAQTRQSIEAGKLIIGAAAVVAIMPPLVGSLALGAAMSVSARNAHTLISAD